MLRFTLFEGKVMIDPSLVMIEEFTNLLSHAGKDKELGNRLLLYVFYCCDLTEQNPLRDVDYRMKEDQALMRAFGSKTKKFTKKEKELLDAAMDAYNFFNETALERASLAYDKKIDEIRSALDELKPQVFPTFDQHGNQSGFASNDKIIANFAKQLNDMAVYKLKAMETAKKIENTGRVRGEKGSSLIERGAFRRANDTNSEG